jgi:hypothetical protein
LYSEPFSALKLTEPALEGHFERLLQADSVSLAQRRIQVTPLGAVVVEGDVHSVVRRWVIAPGAAIRDIGVIRVEHEGLAESDQVVKVRLTEAHFSTLSGRPVDDSGVRSALWTRITMVMEIARIESHG